jgi:hypothetical protein
MTSVRLAMVLLVLAAPLSAQRFTGQFTALGVAGYAPDVRIPAGNQYGVDPDGSAMAGAAWDVSFITGGLRLGPEGFVLRGPARRVWSLGGIARYEWGSASVRPYGLVGAGAYFWDYEFVNQFDPHGPYRTWGSDATVFSLSAGGGLTFSRPGNRLSGTLEVRFHRNLDTPDQGGSRPLLTVGLGARVAW